MLVKLIFNPIAGCAGESPAQLMNIVSELQSWDLAPEIYMIEPGNDLAPVIQEALHRDIRLFVVCGGDGTIESVAGALVGTEAILGIIPTGTRNNVALSLGIPEDIPAAVTLLQKGRRLKVDVGIATCGDHSRFFLEACSIGLLSALFPAADEIQHGNLASIGDFLAALISSPSAEICLNMDDQPNITIQGHVALIANLPYVGPHCQITPEGSFNDGLLDILIFPDLSKLDLLSNITHLVKEGPEEPRIQRYHAQRVDLDTNPPLPVMADGFSLGEGRLHITTQRCALAVMAGAPAGAPDQRAKGGD